MARLDTFGVLSDSTGSICPMKKKSTLKSKTTTSRRRRLRKQSTPPKTDIGERHFAQPDECVVREEPEALPKLRCVELFAGAGGLALAASNAGFEHDVVLEYNHDACETIRSNQRRGFEVVRHWPLIEGDVHHQDFRNWRRRTDLVSGGPPCQPFSQGGKHQAMGDKRNLFPEAARAVREIQPRAFVFENVKGLTRQAFAKYFSYIVLQLSYPEVVAMPSEEWIEHLARLERLRTKGDEPDLNYRVVWRLLNAADYGVPQRRERVFFVGFRSDIQIPWSFPSPTHSREALLRSQWETGDYWERHRVSHANRPAPPAKYLHAASEARLLSTPPTRAPWLTVRDAISDLGEPSVRVKDASFPNHVLQPGARSYPGHTGSPIDEAAKTLKAGVHGVPGGENMLARADGSVRYFTVRESARLQTFPDDYRLHGSWTEAMRQLGNAVPVELAKVIGKSVADHLLRAA